ncbi:MAG: ferrous iron transport protein A [Bacillota bacterium]|nr:MAG: ferrous iron transport protein A [Bacillota bacterium]
MPLTVAPLNREVKVLKVLAEEKTKRHLENLGVLAGERLTVLSVVGGNVICMVKQSRLALDRQLAVKIFVA